MFIRVLTVHSFRPALQLSLVLDTGMANHELTLSQQYSSIKQSPKIRDKEQKQKLTNTIKFSDHKQVSETRRLLFVGQRHQSWANPSASAKQMRELHLWYNKRFSQKFLIQLKQGLGTKFIIWRRIRYRFNLSLSTKFFTRITAWINSEKNIQYYILAILPTVGYTLSHSQTLH